MKGFACSACFLMIQTFSSSQGHLRMSTKMLESEKEAPVNFPTAAMTSAFTGVHLLSSRCVKEGRDRRQAIASASRSENLCNRNFLHNDSDLAILKEPFGVCTCTNDIERSMQGLKFLLYLILAMCSARYPHFFFPFCPKANSFTP